MQKSLLALSVVLALCVLGAQADVYMHSPRGMNNRCDEQNNNRNNNNRLMNTQNNGAGGYATGPPMFYHAGSVLTLEWTAQHGCGLEGKTHCNVVWQYACEDYFKDGESEDPLAQGNGNTCTDEVTADNEDLPTVGRHENLEYFTACGERLRNTNLFTADQNLNENQGAQATRQNPGGNESGFECQEERDYYPYWHPTPFRDIAVLTTDTSRCEYYTSQSENVKGRNICSVNEHNNEEDCLAGAGVWNLEKPNGDPAPICTDAPWSRANSLSSTQDGYMSSFNWTIPGQGLTGLATEQSCIVRIRYNISTADFDSWNVDNLSNDNDDVISQNPYVSVQTAEAGVDNYLRLAIATNQFGRTFQDRSYTFKITRPAITLPFREVWNLNVRGKRGNIAQVRNCLEYDLVPQRLTMRRGDLVHIQWTGSNHNPKGNAGEGTDGTDRHNMVQLINNDNGANYFEAMESQTLFRQDNVAYRAAFIDQDIGTCLKLEELENGNQEQNKNNCALLNQRDLPYFNLGVVRLNRTGTFNYMSTRNNNFSNRGEKSTLFVRTYWGAWTVLIVAGLAAAAIIVAGAGAATVFFVKVGAGSAGSGATSGAGGSKVYKRTASRGSFGDNSSHGSRKSGSSSRSKKSASSFGGSMI